MDSLNFTEMQNMQKKLQEKYKDRWEPVIPGEGRSMLLWMMIEAGGAADVIKKKGDGAIMDDVETRNHFIEELCDVMMYFNDVLTCYSITPEELKKIYLEKHERNMTRW